MSLHVKDSGAWKQVNIAHIKDGGVWKQCNDVYIKDSNTWKSVFYSPGAANFIANSGARNNSTSPGSTDSSSYTWTVPIGVHVIYIDGVGGGGRSGAYHDGGYGQHARVGGPGGGITGVTIPVTPGDTISGVTGGGGGAGFYNGTDNWGYGGAGAATTFYYNGVLIFTANAGGGPGSAGSGTLHVGTYGGSVVSGTAPTNTFDHSDGGPVGNPYNPWAYVDAGVVGTGTANVGAQSVVPDGSMTNSTRLGLGQYPGWVRITW
jgi:hypothetical protein